LSKGEGKKSIFAFGNIQSGADGQTFKNHCRLHSKGRKRGGGTLPDLHKNRQPLVLRKGKIELGGCPRKRGKKPCLIEEDEEGSSIKHQLLLSS